MSKITELIIETCSKCPFIDWKYNDNKEFGTYRYQWWCEKEKIWMDTSTNVLKEIDRNCRLKDFK